MELKSGSISKSVRVGKFVGIGFLNVTTTRGEVKMYSGDHLVEVEYQRAVRIGEKGFISDPGPKDVQPKLTKKTLFVVPEDAARALGIYLAETVEDERERVEKEVAEKKAADAAALAAKEAAAAAKTTT